MLNNSASNGLKKKNAHGETMASKCCLGDMIWCMVYGVWSVYGLWSMVYGPCTRFFAIVTITMNDARLYWDYIHIT
ncbi:hypothetical protein BOTCAL_0371g00080 [Botryotinia calthae]|uniref:Uncharacterized protein n=1 Tax=Botryotinia calthae TaxID=38488 RepID=A0A4Y8CSN3_9HELO|nr:hypothetical protein BOTCAL_0371g00080 [Botryotinia calthae]